MLLQNPISGKLVVFSPRAVKEKEIKLIKYFVKYPTCRLIWTKAPLIDLTGRSHLGICEKSPIRLCA
jgi:hypothetical protein